MNTRKKQSNFSRFKTTQMYFNFTDTTSMRQCTIHSESQWFASIWTRERTWNISSERGSNRVCIGVKRSSKKWSWVWLVHWVIFNRLAWHIEIWNQPTSFWWKMAKSRSLILVSQRITSRTRMMVVLAPWQLSGVPRNTLVQFFGKRTLKMVATLDTLFTIYSSLMFIVVV